MNCFLILSFVQDWFKWAIQYLSC